MKYTFIYKHLTKRNILNLEKKTVLLREREDFWLSNMLGVTQNLANKIIHSWLISLFGNGETYSIKYNNGTKYWYKDGLHHRDGDNPAIIYADGAKFWCKDDNIHRDNDLPAIIFPSGRKEWYKNGKEYFPNNK